MSPQTVKLSSCYQNLTHSLDCAAHRDVQLNTAPRAFKYSCDEGSGLMLRRDCIVRVLFSSVAPVGSSSH